MAAKESTCGSDMMAVHMPLEADKIYGIVYAGNTSEIARSYAQIRPPLYLSVYQET